MTSLLRGAKSLLPFAVSGAILAFLLQRIEAEHVWDKLTPHVAAVLVPVVILFALVSLMFEALSMHCLIRPLGLGVDLWTAARVRAASYPLALVHYALGVTSVTMLLSRRTGLTIANAAGVVLLISFLDLGLLLGITVFGVALLSGEALAVRAGVVVAAGAALVGGLIALRTPISLGPFECIRSLQLLSVARTASWSVLLELLVWRSLFVWSFILIAWVALVAFGIFVPFGNLVVNFAVLSLVATLPIAVAGLGTGQLAFVYLFRAWGPPDILLACSLTMSVALILVRATLGLLFAGEFAREALGVAREVHT